MWECRRRPDYEDEELQTRLEALFDELPAVGFAVSFRGSVTEVFDTAKDRKEAEARLAELRELLEEDDTEFHKLFATYDRWKDGILAYFDHRQSSGPVEGVNNKARVITRRAYGLKSAAAVWTRLHLSGYPELYGIGSRVGSMLQGERHEPAQFDFVAAARASAATRRNPGCPRFAENAGRLGIRSGTLRPGTGADARRDPAERLQLDCRLPPRA